MKKIVLLTGASGFVGRQVFKELDRIGVKIRLVIREGQQNQFNQTANIESILLTANLFNEKEIWWEKACSNIDAVIHVAWYAEPGKYLNSPLNLDCLTGTIALAKSCVKSGVKYFVGVGTCFEYDTSFGYLSIDTPLKPTTIYAATKAAAFLTLSNYFSQSKIEFAWCRLFYLYGEGEDKRRLVPYIRAKLERNEVAELTSGNQVRDFIDVKVAGQMIADCIRHKVIGPINICSGFGITVRQLAEQIADEYGRRDLLNFGIRPDNLVDPLCVVGIK